MKKFIINKAMSFITSRIELTDTKKEELKYGLSSIYITYSKLIVITIIAAIIGMFKQYIIYLIIYNIIRTFSFGLHATKSWICWITSIIIFLGIPYISEIIVIPNLLKSIIGSYLIIRFYMNAPADTKKRPIINTKRRLFFKFVSTILAFAYVLLSVTSKNNFISNAFFFATMIQSLLISPYVYKLFKLPFNNYKTYVVE